MDNMKYKMHFENWEAAALFENGIKGQLSDGKWENARPSNHWEFWCLNTEIVVDGFAYTSGNPRMRNYNLLAKDLLEISDVVDEWKNVIRFVKSKYFSPELLTHIDAIMGGWKYRYEPEEINMEKIVKSIEWELNSRYERVYREFKDCNITEEFQNELKVVLAEGLKAKRVNLINRSNAEKEEMVKILNKHGITLENFEDVRKEVKEIEVTDADLRTVLQSIMKTMRRDCPEGKIVIFP